ncbi:hypothetical protein ACIBG8_09250 [Nonomuraea sp. NPDC050556]|uniref:hypothetical protein n=1 Tax=Nonomuraea sp. NPDC050556 TaxID=3364369 RepID=UPI003792382B
MNRSAIAASGRRKAQTILLSSVSTPTGKMGAGARHLVQNQPLPSIIDTVRSLVTGTPSAGTVVTAITWCVVIVVIGCLWIRDHQTRGSRSVHQHETG